MVSERRAEMEMLLNQLRKPLTYPEFESESVQDAWIELMEIDASIAGSLSTGAIATTSSRQEVKAFQQKLASRQDWRQHWPEQVSLLTRACELLLAGTQRF